MSRRWEPSTAQAVWIVQRYYVRGDTLTAVAAKLGVPRSTLAAYLRRRGLALDSRSAAQRKRLKVVARRRAVGAYVRGASLRSAAARAGISHTTLRRELLRSPPARRVPTAVVRRPRVRLLGPLPESVHPGRCPWCSGGLGGWTVAARVAAWRLHARSCPARPRPWAPGPQL